MMQIRAPVLGSADQQRSGSRPRESGENRSCSVWMVQFPAFHRLTYNTPSLPGSPAARNLYPIHPAPARKYSRQESLFPPASGFPGLLPECWLHIPSAPGRSDHCRTPSRSPPMTRASVLPLSYPVWGFPLLPKLLIMTHCSQSPVFLRCQSIEKPRFLWESGAEMESRFTLLFICLALLFSHEFCFSFSVLQQQPIPQNRLEVCCFLSTMSFEG